MSRPRSIYVISFVPPSTKEFRELNICEAKSCEIKVGEIKVCELDLEKCKNCGNIPNEQILLQFLIYL